MARKEKNDEKMKSWQGKGNLLIGESGPLHREFPPCQIGHLSKILSF
jgi:hypothetical protein